MMTKTWQHSARIHHKDTRMIYTDMNEMLGKLKRLAVFHQMFSAEIRTEGRTHE